MQCSRGRRGGEGRDQAKPAKHRYLSPSLVMPSTLNIQHLCFLLAALPVPAERGIGVEVAEALITAAVAAAILNKTRRGDATSCCCLVVKRRDDGGYDQGCLS